MAVFRAAALVVLLACGPVLTREDARAWGPPQSLCTLDDKGVGESSGVAASQIQSGVFFTHNDSGDSARFFRFRKDGKVDGTYTLKGAKAVDWEDMASATVGGTSYLYFGDVGDNAERRPHVVVYRVLEPTEPGHHTIEEYETYIVTYPDGPHNCESLFITRSGDIWVVTKHPGGISGVYMLKSPAKSGSYKFRHVADLRIDTGGSGGKYATGAAVSPDEKFVVVRTYTAALEFGVKDSFQDWVKSKPINVRTPLEIQGEAVCYSRDGASLITTSEFAPCSVSLIPLKGP